MSVRYPHGFGSFSKCDMVTGGPPHPYSENVAILGSAFVAVGSGLPCMRRVSS